MNTIQYGNITTQVDITKYIKLAETIPQTQEPGTVQNVETVQDPAVATGLETGVEARPASSFDELKAVLVSAKIPVTDENIKTAGLMIKSGIEVQKENIEAAADIKKQVEYIINHVNESALTSITGDGIALDKVTMDILEEVIQQVNQKEDTVKVVSDDAVKVAMDQYISENDLAGKLGDKQKQTLYICVKNVMAQDLPVTTKNVQTLLGAVDKAYEMGTVNEKIAISLIKKDQPLTLEAIYVAKYSSNASSDKTTKPVSDEAFKQLLPQIEKLIQAQGIDNKEQAIKAARVLVDNELSVTAENINKIIDIDQMQHKDINIERIVYEAAKNIKIDKAPMDIALDKVTQTGGDNKQIEKINIEAYKKNTQIILDNISKYDDETIKSAIDTAETITLKDLQIAYEQKEQKAVQKYIEDNHLQQKLSPSQKQVLQLCVKNLIEQDLPVTTKNVQALLGAVDKAYGIGQVNKNTVIDLIKKDQPITLEAIDAAKKIDKEIMDIALDQTLKKDQDASETLTLKELQQVYEKIKQEVLQKDEKGTSEKSTEMVQETTKQLEKDVEKELKTVTAKRQLAEIRLRLTSESMTTLIKKGIEVDTLPLKEVVEELKSVEAELYKASLSRVGAAPTTENITQMQDLYQKLESIKTISSPTYNKVMQADIPFTIEGLSEAEVNLQIQHATASYEVAQTQPSTRFGDTFSKVADQVEPLVTDLGLEASKENIRAAKILVKNNIDVTDENIAAIKLIDVKVGKVTTQLHPTIAANMIKDGFNIVQTDIDEVINYMNGFDKLLGEDLTDKIASYIYEMDQTGELASSERETMIGIYRMLYTVEKTQGRATGFLYKNDMPLTLGNLMQAAKYYDRTAAKQSDIDVNIDDAFGTLEELVIPEKTIKAQLGTLQASTGQNTQNNQAQLSTVEYEQNIIDKFIEKASPDVISKIVKQYPDLETMPLETLLKTMETVQEYNTDKAQGPEAKTATQTQEFVKNLGKLASVEPTTLLWMKNNQIPLTVSNIETIQNFMKDAFYFGEQMDHFSKQVKEKLGKAEGLKNAITKTDLSELKAGKSVTEVLEDLEKEVSAVKKEAIDLPEQQRQSLWKQADNLEKAIQLQKQVQKDETLYQIPIQLSSGLANMNLYVMNNKEGDGKLSEKDMKVFLSMKTETLGTVQIYMKLTDKNVSFQINTDQADATRFLQANQMALQANIEKLGYMVGRMNYGQEQPKSPLQTQIQPQIKTSRSNITNDGFEVVV